MVTPEHAPASPAPPATLTDWLRSRSDDDLADLLRARPDLGLPAPADMSTLASRVSVRTSVQRAIDGLDAWQIRVLEALTLTTDDTSADLAAAHALLGADPSGALDELRRLVLVWGADSDLHVIAGLAAALGPYPAGLGRPVRELIRGVSDPAIAPMLRTHGLPLATQPISGQALAALLEDPGFADGAIAMADEAEQAVLTRLAAGPPVGLVADAQGSADLADPSPAKRLLARGLLLPIDTRTVELPREIALRIRGDAPLGSVQPEPVEVATTDRTAEQADREGTTAVLGMLHSIESLAMAWVRHSVATLRSGGLGVRELRRTARALDLDERGAGLVIEVASAAGLVGPTSGIDPTYLPTQDYDIWSRRDTAARWVQLGSAWLGMSRQPGLIGQRDERDRVVNALGPDAERGTVPALRRTVLTALDGLPPGAQPSDRDAVLARIEWLAPRRFSTNRALVEQILAEADLLGVTSAGGLTSYGRALLAGTPGAAERVLDQSLPAPVDHFLVQPDLTVVVPGPPVAELARELTLAADLESVGGASVYRITEASLRRALDAGRSGTDLAALFADRSRTPVPQALSYLLDDVARRHGVLRSGAATAYLRCDHQSLLDRVVADRAVDGLHLRRIAPTVVISSAAVNRVLEVLREAGYAPAAESPDGAVLTLVADEPRAPSRSGTRIVRVRPAADTTGHVGELVRRVRAGDALNEISRRSTPITQLVPGVTSATTLGLLREAIRGGRSIWLGYVDAEGTASQHTIVPISMAGGTLRGHEAQTSRLQSFPLHRITAVTVVDDD